MHFAPVDRAPKWPRLFDRKGGTTGVMLGSGGVDAEDGTHLHHPCTWKWS